MCCDSWGRKELDTTEQLNLTELKQNAKTPGCLSCTARAETHRPERSSCCHNSQWPPRLTLRTCWFGEHLLC